MQINKVEVCVCKFKFIALRDLYMKVYSLLKLKNFFIFVRLFRLISETDGPILPGLLIADR